MWASTSRVHPRHKKIDISTQLTRHSSMDSSLIMSFSKHHLMHGCCSPLHMAQEGCMAPTCCSAHLAKIAQLEVRTRLAGAMSQWERLEGPLLGSFAMNAAVPRQNLHDVYVDARYESPRAPAIVLLTASAMVVYLRYASPVHIPEGPRCCKARPVVGPGPSASHLPEACPR